MVSRPAKFGGHGLCGSGVVLFKSADSVSLKHIVCHINRSDPGHMHSW